MSSKLIILIKTSICRLLDTVWKKLKALGGHLYCLKTVLLLMAGCWWLLTVDYPLDGPAPRYWTAIYAVAKTTIGVCLAYIILMETAPYMRLRELLEVFRASMKRPNPLYAVAAALAFAGAALALAIMTHAIIPSVAQW